MLTLVYGKDWTTNRNYILNMIAQDVALCKPRRILIVPELISHETERRLCSVAGDTCSRYAEVVSFTRLTNRICDWAGAGIRECLDNGGRLIAMAAAVRQLHSKLKAYAALETKPEFLSALVDAVDEFKRCCISPADLSNAAQNSHGSFAQKLEELSLLLESYEAVCQQGKADPRDLLNWGLELLQDSTFSQNHVFYIDGFPDFTLQNLAVIEHFIINAPHVVISMNCDKPGSASLAFSKAAETAKKLLRIAEQNNVEIKLIHVPTAQTPLTPVCEKLFQGAILAKIPSENTLLVTQANSIYEECVLAAERINSLIQGGSRYKEISLVCADLPKYRNALIMQMNLCKIPTYIAGTDDILDKPVILTVLTALDAALGGLETKDILCYLKSGLSPLSLDGCDKIENYTLMWSIQGKQWLNDWTLHPEGLREIWTEQNQLDLDALNTARSMAITPIDHLREAFRKAQTLHQQIEALYGFFKEIHLREKLSELAADMDAVKDNRSAQILNQLWEILLSALEQMDALLGHTHWSDDSFIRLFRLLLSQYDVGTIPPSLDMVMVGSVSAMRCQQVKHLIVLGAAEGCFPGYGSVSGILSDQERNTLRNMGIPLTGGASDGLEIEFSEIYSVFSGACETAYISCLSGQSSFIYRRIAQMAGGIQEVRDVLGAAAADPTESAAYLCRHKQPNIAKSLGLTDRYTYIKQRSEHTVGSISEDGIRALYGNKLNLSASQVDKQADCRFAYFLKYGLRASEQKPVSVDPAEFGTFVHAVLEQTGRDICKMGGFKSVGLSETLEIAGKYAEAYIASHFSQVDSERITYLFQRNNRELMMVVEELWSELQESSFEPVDFELGFGDQQQLPAISISSNHMDASLRGFVDRVDIWKDKDRNYYRVVDYKTGKKDFDYCDVFNGLGMQMLLYLFALQENGETLLGDSPIPAGVQYFPARVPVLSLEGTLTDEEIAFERKSTWKRKGLILNDDDILYAMENTDSPTRLSCKRKKDGTVVGDIASRDQFKQLCQYVFQLLGKMVDDIASGNVTPNPYTRGSSHNACRFCPYGSICHAATVEDRRNYQMMSSQRFWEEIAKEVNGHG